MERKIEEVKELQDEVLEETAGGITIFNDYMNELYYCWSCGCTAFEPLRPSDKTGPGGRKMFVYKCKIKSCGVENEFPV